MKTIVTSSTLVIAIFCSSLLFAQEPPGNGEVVSKSEREFLELAEKFNADLELIYKSFASGQEVAIEFPFMPMVDDFLDLESRNRGTRVGFSCLFHLIVQAGKVSEADLKVTKGKQKALKILGAYYADYPDIGTTFRHLLSGARVPESANFLREVGETTSSASIRANAMLALANVLANEANYAAINESRLSLLDESNPDHEGSIKLYQLFAQQIADIDSDIWRKEARGILETLAANYPDVLESPFADARKPALIRIERSDVDAMTHVKRRRVVDLIPSVAFELAHGIGQKPPEIDQGDVAGNAMRLSEFHGKVVVLMFSFTGCGPCEEMYPGNRELVEELTAQPFVFVSIVRDPKVQSVLESIASKKITWRVWLDSDTTLSQQWNIRAWPTVYVMDSEGVIRFKDIRGESLKLAVRKLIDAAVPTPDK